ncbi:hypothetical protein PAPYR_10063 [Paratrimastix pyriformis]|uniref:Uncharacterized protein n=1 Tax=Paratrimastix pyriformis TaxID=342808 RepID=A0ABQ8U8G9_9EUKA|nr:hypothetical protein PAPYR_10063 [Paratrimastix pyriformis]
MPRYFIVLLLVFSSLFPYLHGYCPPVGSFWVFELNHDCWVLNNNQNKWPDARTFCANVWNSTVAPKGGDLASIRSQLEYEVINKVVTNQEFWIGFTRNSLTSPFYWVDGTPVNFTRWATDQPAKGSNYAVMSSTNAGKGFWYTVTSSTSAKCSMTALCTAKGDLNARCLDGRCICSSGEFFGPLCERPPVCPTPTISVGATVVSGCVAGGALGSACTLGCTAGYYQAPGATPSGTCTQSAAGVEPTYGTNMTCIPYACPAPSLPPHAVVASGCLAGAPLGSDCTLGCKLGYGASGSAAYPCTATGATTAAFMGGTLVCTPLTCAAPSPDPSMLVVAGCTAGGALNDTCTLACANGYTASGSGSYVCQGTGPGVAEYAGGSLACTAATCPALAPADPLVLLSGCIENGPLGSPCQLGCADGYVAAGSDAYPCAPTGPGTAAYTGGSLTCSPVTCPALVPSDPSMVVVSGCQAGGALGAPCTLGCAPGLVASGDPSYPCAGTGSNAAVYSGGALTCTAPGTCPPPVLDHSQAVLSGCAAGGAVGSSCTLRCADGYQSTGGSADYPCTGTISPTYTGGALTCQAVDCPALVPTGAGLLVVGGCDAGPLGSLCALACEAGYMPAGDSTATCTGTAVGAAAYTGASINCTGPHPWGESHDLPSGHGLSERWGMHGGPVRLHSRLERPRVRPPRCRHPSPSVPPPSPEGNCTSNVDCQHGGTCLGTAPTKTCSCPLGWGGPLCQTQTYACPAPSLGAGVEVLAGCVDGSPLGATCLLGCRYGMVAAGTNSSTCTDSGTPGLGAWVGSSLTCTPATCAALVPPAPAEVAWGCGDSGSQGTECVLRCPWGYHPSGTAEYPCLATGPGSAAYTGGNLTCSAVSCPERVPSSAEVVLEGCGNATLGTPCRVECAWGYMPEGVGNYTCQGLGPGMAGYAGGNLSCTPVTCPALVPSDPNMVVVSGCQAGGALGAPCTLGCAPGLVASGDPSYPCAGTAQGSALYTGGSLSCTSPGVCPPPVLDPSQAVLSGCAAGGAVGSPCKLRCADGYQSTGGSADYPCTGTTSPTYTGGALTCQAVTCPSFTEAILGATIYEGCYDGAKCFLRCEQGYQPEGHSDWECVGIAEGLSQYVGGDMTCNALNCTLDEECLNGGFCSALGQCVCAAGWSGPACAHYAVFCPAWSVHQSEFIAGGCLAGAAVGDPCKVGCADGFIQSGDGSYSCDAAARWTGGSLLCVAATCPALTPAYPELVLSGCGPEGPHGANCTLGCAPGYAASGSASYPCTGTGPGVAAYTGGAVNCVAATCPALTPTGPLLVESGCLANGTLGALCSLNCSAGFFASGDPNYTCLGTGPGAAAYVGGSLTCTPFGTCPPPVVDASRAVLSGCAAGGAVGSSCKLRCADGYQSTGGSADYPCTGTISPTYTGGALTCQAVQCPAMPLALGQVVVSGCGEGPLDSGCTLRCESGYMPSGGYQYACTGTAIGAANYTGGSLNCSPAPCLSSGDCNGGTCSAVGIVPGNCTCLPGWSGPGCAHLEGNCTAAADCLHGGTCLGAAPAKYCTCPLGWAGAQCQVQTIACAAWLPHLSEVVLSGCGDHAPYGAGCQVQCASGYIQSGTGAYTCGLDGLWAGGSLVCTAATCPALTPAYPELVLSGCGPEGPHGANCTLGCAPGYAASGSDSYPCTATGPGTAAYTGGAVNCVGLNITCLVALPNRSARVGHHLQSLWDAHIARCRPLLILVLAAATCPALVPAAPAMVLAGCTAGGALGASCTLACPGGYVASGNASYPCAGAGPGTAAYVGGSLTCTAPGTCPPPALDASRAVLSGCAAGGAVSSSCRLRCADGYQSTGGSVDYPCTGTTSPTYTGGTLTCQAVQCPALPLALGQVVVSGCGEGPLGSGCTLRCESGYMPSGGYHYTCTGTAVGAANYTGGSLTCSPSKCRSNTDCNGGTCSAVGVVPGNCTCLPGWSGPGCARLEGNCTTAADCLHGGTCLGAAPTKYCTCPLGWTGAQCQVQTIACAAWLPHLSELVLSGCGDHAPYGAGCQVQCASGYIQSGTGAYTCGLDGLWAGGSLVCTAATCPALTPAYPELVLSGCGPEGPHGANCTLGCAPGYAASGSASYPCTGTGPGVAAYTGGALNCVAATCPALVPAAPAMVLAGCTAGGALGASCTLACPGGYVASGNASYPCAGAGPGTAAYVGGSLTCTAPGTCPPPALDASRAVLSGCAAGGAVSSSCTLRCADGYQSTGGSADYPCTGTISPTYTGGALTCQGPQAPAPVIHVINPIPTTTSFFATAAVQCPALPLALGQVVVSGCGEGPLGSGCTLRCESGYMPSGGYHYTCTGTAVGAANYTGGSLTCSPVGCLSSGDCNGGTCSAVGSVPGNCTCLPGWSGPGCAHHDGNCTTDADCAHGGTCRGTAPTKTCSCPVGYSGPRCLTLGLTPPSHSERWWAHLIIVCTLTDGDCTTNADCANGGSCVVWNPRTIGCSPLWLTRHPVLSALPDAHFELALPYPEGLCARDTDCAHGGNCTGSSPARTCACAVGYSGPLCQDTEGNCTLDSDCNGGVCTGVAPTRTCACPTGYSGKNCETHEGSCTGDNQCHHGAICVGPAPGRYCNCTAGWGGPTCNTTLPAGDPCLTDTECQAGGDFNATCASILLGASRAFANDVSPFVVAFRCRCSAGFVGSFCRPAPSFGLVIALSVALPILFLALFFASWWLCCLRRRRSAAAEKPIKAELADRAETVFSPLISRRRPSAPQAETTVSLVTPVPVPVTTRTFVTPVPVDRPASRPASSPSQQEEQPSSTDVTSGGPESPTDGMAAQAPHTASFHSVNLGTGRETDVLQITTSVVPGSSRGSLPGDGWGSEADMTDASMSAKDGATAASVSVPTLQPLKKPATLSALPDDDQETSPPTQRRGPAKELAPLELSPSASSGGLLTGTLPLGVSTPATGMGPITPGTLPLGASTPATAGPVSLAGPMTPAGGLTTPVTPTSTIAHVAAMLGLEDHPTLSDPADATHRAGGLDMPPVSERAALSVGETPEPHGA